MVNKCFSFLYSSVLILGYMTYFVVSQVTSIIMGLNLQIKKLQEVISLMLEENIIDNDDDLNVAEEITEVFQKHIDLVDTYKILHQSTKHNNLDETSTTNDNFTVIQPHGDIDQDDNYQDLLDDNVGESVIEEDRLDNNIEKSNIEGYKNQNEEGRENIYSKNLAESKVKEEQMLNNVQNLSIFKCIFCDVEFKDQLQMNEHDNKNHKFNDNYTCISCVYVSTEKKGAVQHFLIEHKNKMLFNCSKCGEILMSYKEALLHMKRDHRLKLDTNTCPICMIEITNASKKMKTHMALEHGLGKFCCEICDTKFIEEEGLQKHNKRYHEEGAEKTLCLRCGKLILKSLLKQHKEEHQITGKTVPCPTCNKLFYGDRDMKRHKWRAHRSILFNCDQCGYQTKYKESLTTHLSYKHSSDQPFSCDECGKRVKSASILKYHKLIHTGERRYVCKFCGKKFKTSTNLRVHTILHTKEYEAHCEICGQNFAQRYNYKMHVKKHHPIKSSS